jgi:pimeloyl-ACP methyl ester carboxylesterase
VSNTITPTVFYRTLNVEGLEIFYREAGPQDAPTVLLLHGFPSSSHMFRNLIVGRRSGSDWVVDA